MGIRSGSAAVAMALSVLSLESTIAEAAEIRILTARAGATVLEKIASECERVSGHKVQIITGFGPELVRRINAGEPFDILIAGAPAIDGLIKSGKIIADTRRTLLRSGMGVEVRAGAPKPDIGSVAALKRALLAAKSIGYLKLVNGVEKLFERLDVADAIQPKVNAPGSDIVSELVAKGEIELAVVVITQIRTTPGVELVGPLPAEIQYEIQFVSGISADTKALDAARELVKFFTGPAALPVIRAQGMEPG